MKGQARRAGVIVRAWVNTLSFEWCEARVNNVLQGDESRSAADRSSYPARLGWARPGRHGTSDGTVSSLS